MLGYMRPAVSLLETWRGGALRGSDSCTSLEDLEDILKSPHPALGTPESPAVEPALVDRQADDAQLPPADDGQAGSPHGTAVASSLWNNLSHVLSPLPLPSPATEAAEGRCSPCCPPQADGASDSGDDGDQVVVTTNPLLAVLPLNSALACKLTDLSGGAAGGGGGEGGGSSERYVLYPVVGTMAVAVAAAAAGGLVAGPLGVVAGYKGGALVMVASGSVCGTVYHHLQSNEPPENPAQEYLREPEARQGLTEAGGAAWRGWDAQHNLLQLLDGLGGGGRASECEQNAESVLFMDP